MHQKEGETKTASEASAERKRKMEKPARVKVGDILAGKYRVERMLGHGGMGIVVAATHLDLQELFAIKMLHAEGMKSERSVQRFLREARAAIRLRSEHVARVFDVGRLDNGAPYMVMEHLAGSDLRALLEMRKKLPIHDVVSYILMACEGLAEAHAAGIVHRDLKPANLFLTRRADGSPCIKLLDFGISKMMTPGGDDMNMTRTRELLGSPLYMAPEQMRSGAVVDTRTDIWALGVILYKLITGKFPFFAKGMMEICAIVLERTPLPPSRLRPDLPHGLEQIILRCLSKDPNGRFQTVNELAAALEPYATPQPFESDAELISVLLLDRPVMEAQARVADAWTGASSRAQMSWTAQTPPRAKRRRGVVATVAMTFAGLLLSASVTTAGGALVVRHEPVSQLASQPPAFEATPEHAVMTEANAVEVSSVGSEAHAADVSEAKSSDVQPAVEQKETREQDVKPAVQETKTEDSGASAPSTVSTAAWKPRALPPSPQDPFGLQQAAP
jgi:serine/threonine-protein kinase